MKMRMWLVKREVLATTIEKAAHNKGFIYEISLAEDKVQPENTKKKTGFKSK